MDDTCSFESKDETITAQAGDRKASVPDSGDSDKDGNPNTVTQGNAYAGTKIGYDWGVSKPIG